MHSFPSRPSTLTSPAAMTSSVPVTDTSRLPARVLCVLGMHRSGTSCLTGSLQQAGICLGDCHTWNPYNRKGNRENQRIVDLNDRVLAENGGAWNHPPVTVKWSASALMSARALLADHADSAVFGFKDPRTLLVLDGWKTVCPHLQFIGVFRHPLAVADSLARRDGMSTQDALALWYQYNRRLYQQWQRGSFPVLCFDAPQAEFNAKLADVLREAGMGSPENCSSFYDPDLRSAQASGTGGLPWRIRMLLRKLQRIAR